MNPKLKQAYENARWNFIRASTRNSPDKYRLHDEYAELSDAYHGIGTTDTQTMKRLEDIK